MPEPERAIRVRMARETRGYSRNELAKLIECREYDLWNLEINDVDLPPGSWDRLIGCLGLPLSFYYGNSFHRNDIVDRDRFGVRWDNSECFDLHPKAEDMCQHCGIRSAEALCDYPMGDGRTCSLRLCDACRTRRTETVDWCPQHNAMYAQWLLTQKDPTE